MNVCLSLSGVAAEVSLPEFDCLLALPLVEEGFVGAEHVILINTPLLFLVLAVLDFVKHSHISRHFVELADECGKRHVVLLGQHVQERSQLRQ